MTLRLATQLGSPEFREVTDPHPEVWRLRLRPKNWDNPKHRSIAGSRRVLLTVTPTKFVGGVL